MVHGLVQGDELILVSVWAVAERGLGAQVVVALHVLAKLEAALEDLLFGGAVNVLEVTRRHLGRVRGDGIVKPVGDGGGEGCVRVFADEEIFPHIGWRSGPGELGESLLAHASVLLLQR